ncbi:MAG: DDE-type integrase/transposase/recombinase [Firmicutes bacterium]|nr:DDE-type integrase/transposase/recombinase [Bacillota bacterium]
MDSKTRDEVALFKFSLIAPLLNGTASSTKEYLETVCARKHQVPGTGLREFSPSTILSWLHAYRNYGFEALKRKPRKDKGSTRKLSPQAVQAVKDLVVLSPPRTSTSIYCELLSKGLLGNPPASLSTLQRLMKKLDPPPKTEPSVERKRFELEFANQCWQADSCVGPYLYMGPRKRKTYLIALLDDASRLCVHTEFFFAENVIGLTTVLKKAIAKRGIPNKLFTDNAKIFSSLHLRTACAALGTVVSHSRIYSPESKGKIERFFRTLREQFFVNLDPDSLTSLESLNCALWAYIEETYNRRPHSSLGGLSPLERYLKDQNRFRFAPSKEYLDMIFLYEARRRVAKDATISVMKTVFEVPQHLIGSSCTIRFDPQDLSRAFVLAGGDSSPITVYPVRPHDNSKLPRKQNQRERIDYTRLYQGGELK